MEEFEKERMVFEYKELEDRVIRLNAFLNFKENAEKRKNISAEELELMHNQLWAMKAYCKALLLRLQKRGISFKGCNGNDSLSGIALFKELPHIDSSRFTCGDNEGYVPSLYFYDGFWIVDLIHCEDGDSLLSFSGETPEEAIQKAYKYYKEYIIQFPE